MGREQTGSRLKHHLNRIADEIVEQYNGRSPIPLIKEYRDRVGGSLLDAKDAILAAMARAGWGHRRGGGWERVEEMKADDPYEEGRRAGLREAEKICRELAPTYLSRGDGFEGANACEHAIRARLMYGTEEKT